MLKFCVSFDVFHIDLNPGEITEALGIQPDAQLKRGEHRVGKSGRKYGPSREGLWSLSSSLADTTALEAHIKFLTDKLDSKKALLADFRRKGLNVEIFIGVFMDDFNEVFKLKLDVLETITALSADLNFDVYEP